MSVYWYLDGLKSHFQCSEGKILSLMFAKSHKSDAIFLFIFICLFM